MRAGAAIYNIIPDVLSRLSAAESVDSDMFKRVMKHLLSLIEKVPAPSVWFVATSACGCVVLNVRPRPSSLLSGEAIGEPHGEALPSPSHRQR
jgi:hypothetical protein